MESNSITIEITFSYLISSSANEAFLFFESYQVPTESTLSHLLHTYLSQVGDN